MYRPTLLVLIFSITQLVSQSQWRWINPTPSGATAAKILFTDNQNGFIFNSNAELIHTRDLGVSWQIVDTFPGMTCFDMKGNTGVIGGFGGTFYISKDKGNTWQQRSNGSTDHLLQISMVSENVFFFYNNYDSKIFKTIDGGNSWQTLICDQRIEKAFFITENLGYIGTSDDILKTTDGGTTWQSLNKTNIIPATIHSLYFTDSNTGFVFRGHDQMMKTTNGGQSWESVRLSDNIYSIHFSDANNGYAGGVHGALYRTVDAGKNWDWIGVSARISGYNINSVYFLSNNTGFAVGGLGRILKTTDGGNTWTPYAVTYNQITSLKFPSKNVAYATTGTDIYKTVDRGKSWASIKNFPISSYSSFRKSHFVNENVGFVTTDNIAKLYRTTDGGQNWNELLPTRYYYENISDIDFISPLVGYMALQTVSASAIVKTTDGGATWQSWWEAQYQGENFYKIDVVNETTAYAARYNSVYKTTDNAQTWQKVYERDFGDLNDIYFINENKGFICGDQGFFQMTTDGGANWTTIEQNWSEVYPYDIEELNFFTEDMGYLRMGESGKLFKTTDGGLTWNIDGNYGGSNITFTPDSTIYISGGGGSIITNSIKTSGLHEFSLLSNNKCSVSFSVKQKKDASPLTDIWLELKDGMNSIRVAAMTRQSENSQSEYVIYTSTVAGLPGNFNYTARVGFTQEGATSYFGNSQFTVKGFDQPTITVLNNGTTLSSSIVASSEWYYNGSPVPGINSHQMQPEQNGRYFVVANEGGCISAPSNPVNYIKNNLGVSIHPNPVTSYIIISNTHQRKLDVKIFDVNGVYKVSTYITEITKHIQLPYLSSGTYTLQITDRDSKETVLLRFLRQ